MGREAPIALDAVIQRNDTKFLFNKLGEEMVMMNMENGDFISMNSVGADIWALSGQPIAISDLVEKLQELYDITEDQCINETLCFLQASREQDMFRVVNTNNA